MDVEVDADDDELLVCQWPRGSTTIVRQAEGNVSCTVFHSVGAPFPKAC